MNQMRRKRLPRTWGYVVKIREPRSGGCDNLYALDYSKKIPGDLGHSVGISDLQHAKFFKMFDFEEARVTAFWQIGEVRMAYIEEGTVYVTPVGVV